MPCLKLDKTIQPVFFAEYATATAREFQQAAEECLLIGAELRHLRVLEPDHAP
jgi:hypothetical protein